MSATLKADYSIRGNEIFYRGYVVQGKGTKRFKSNLPHQDYSQAMTKAGDGVVIDSSVYALENQLHKGGMLLRVVEI